MVDLFALCRFFTNGKSKLKIMRNRLVISPSVLLIFVLITSCTQKAELIEGDALVVLEGVILIDGTGNAPVFDAAIVLQGDQINRVGKKGDFRYPDDATIHNLEGRWVIPGLIEMHAHLPAPEFQEEVLRTYVAFGVTTLFNPAATPGTGVEVREKVATGELFGPAISTAGKAINGTSFLDGAPRWVIVDTEEAVRAEVQHQAEKGVDYVKFYAHLPPDLARVAIDEAHGFGLKVVGHLGKTGWHDAARAGIDVILHSALSGPTWELIPEDQRDDFRDNYLPSANYPEDYDPSLFRQWRETVNLDGPELEELINLLLENKTVVDPNLVVYESIIWGNDPETRERLEPDYAPKPMRTQWRQGLNPGLATWTDEDFAEVQSTWPVFLEIVRRFHERGVPLTAGTDLGNPWITPGPALHREYELLVSAGIPPLEVLTIATANPARALGIIDEVGTVEPGKRADLVILTADPLQDIRNTRAIGAVIKGGQWYGPDSLLAGRE